MKKTLPIVIALLVGVGLGSLIFGGRRDSRSAGDRKSPAGDAAQCEPGQAGGQNPTTGGGARQSGPSRPTGSLLRSVRSRNVKLAQENKRLTERLGVLEQDLLFARGKPMSWPARTPARLKRQAVMKAVNQALRQAGLDGEVTDVDCKEFPCVLSGNLKGKISASRFQKVLSTKALRPYDSDHAQTSITNRSGHDSVGRPWQRSHFAIAILLGGPAGTQPDVKRTVYRLRQLLDATTGQ